MSTKKTISASILSAILAVGTFAATSGTTVFAQTDDNYGNGHDRQDDDSARSMLSGNTTTASSNNTMLSGVIASLQNNEMGASTWITAGHWKLESDGQLFEDDTESMVSNFSATIYMASITNGSNVHQHEITDFTQTSILHSSGNSTTINGTMTVSMSDGPHQNTSGYVNLQNNRISIWLEPAGLEQDHFGPTPIYGIILPDSHMMGDENWSDDDENGRDDSPGTTTQGHMDDDDANDD